MSAPVVSANVAAGPLRLDLAGPVRSGEELDVAKLHDWLVGQGLDLRGKPVLTQYGMGASNWTYRLRYANEDLIVRRPPAGTKAKSAHDMQREYRIQGALAGVYPYVPRMIAHCADPRIIGAEFYVMQRLEGIIPRKNLPRGLELTPQAVRRLCTNVLDALIALHRVELSETSLGALGAGTGYVRRQVEGWSRRYVDARTWNVPRGRKIMAWLAEHLPDEGRLCLTHNDFRFDNVVLGPDDPTRVVGVLDWELATVGDPLMDLGNTLAYWVEAGDDVIARAGRRQPTHLPGMLTRKEVVAYYCGATGQRPQSFAFYEVYGLFRLSVIAQQIYYRYHRGETRNQAFKNFWVFVNYLHWRCLKAMRTLN